MAITATTLSAACGAADVFINVASATGITAPNFTSGVGITYLVCVQELMLVTAVNGTVISVQRGYGGTPAMAHGASAPIAIGAPSDWPAFVPAIKAQADFLPAQSYGFSAPVVSAATITASGPLFHLTGTTAVVTINAPAGYIQGGEGAGIIIVFDGSGSGLTWTAAGNIAVAGTATTAGSSVSFIFDQGSGKWHPSRLA